MTLGWLEDNSFKDCPLQFVPSLLEGDCRIFHEICNGCILDKIVIFFGSNPGLLVEVSLSRRWTSQGFADCHRKLRKSCRTPGVRPDGRAVRRGLGNLSFWLVTWYFFRLTYDGEGSTLLVMSGR